MDVVIALTGVFLQVVGLWVMILTLMLNAAGLALAILSRRDPGRPKDEPGL